MINVNSLRNGTTFEEDGTPYKVIKYQFTKMGRGTGNVKVKVRNLKNGAVVTKTYTTGNKVEAISLVRKKMQYLYEDKDEMVFMDPKSYEQIEIEIQKLAKQKDFLVEGIEVEVLFWNDEALTVELPVKMEYEIKKTDPGEKGNSATNIYKPAVLENGLKIKVPLFLKIGERVRVDTRTKEYVERA